MIHIFLTSDRRSEFRAALEAHEPTAVALHESMRTEREAIPQYGDVNATDRARLFENAQNRACHAWLEEDRDLAGTAWADLERLTRDYDGSDLGKGGNALAAVLGWDFVADLLKPADRRAFAGRIAGIAESILEIRKGNPHIVTNNWWMITHGACLLSCIAADGEEGPDGPIDLSDLKAWALGRFKAFCQVFGNAGLYHEGSGYISYTLSMLMPAMVAVERHLEPGILEEFPQFRLSIPSMLVGTAPVGHLDNGADHPTFGAALQWNDTGRTCLGLNPFIPGMILAPAQWRGALRSWFDRLVGVEGRNRMECQYRGLPLTVALYPFSATPEDPEGVLPKWVCDQRQGLGMWRGKWADGSESVVGWYARSTHAGGHSHDDAASIRLISHGRTWICGGGQARPEAACQSVFTHARMEDRPKPAPLAHLTCSQLGDTGGVVGIDTRKSLGAYSERYLAWRTDLGKPLVMAVMDLLDDHRNPPLDWQWNLSFPRELEASVHDDASGFSLLDPDKGILTARFLLDRPDRLEVAGMPATSRTYSNGKKVDYPGDRYMHAAFDRRPNARILLGIVISEPGMQPAVEFSENAIRIDGRAWNDPFFPAVLKSVDLATSVPNRMTQPAG